MPRGEFVKCRAAPREPSPTGPTAGSMRRRQRGLSGNPRAAASGLATSRSMRRSCRSRRGCPTPHNIPQARYLPLPVISRRSISATRSYAARGVTLSSRAIMPADRIGRATTRSASAGRLELEPQPTNLRLSGRRASSHRTWSCFATRSQAPVQTPVAKRVSQRTRRLRRSPRPSCVSNTADWQGAFGSGSISCSKVAASPVGFHPTLC